MLICLRVALLAVICLALAPAHAALATAAAATPEGAGPLAPIRVTSAIPPRSLTADSAGIFLTVQVTLPERDPACVARVAGDALGHAEFVADDSIVIVAGSDPVETVFERDFRVTNPSAGIAPAPATTLAGLTGAMRSVVVIATDLTPPIYHMSELWLLPCWNAAELPSGGLPLLTPEPATPTATVPPTATRPVLAFSPPAIAVVSPTATPEPTVVVETGGHGNRTLAALAGAGGAVALAALGLLAGARTRVRRVPLPAALITAEDELTGERLIYDLRTGPPTVEITRDPLDVCLPRDPAAGQDDTTASDDTLSAIEQEFIFDAPDEWQQTLTIPLGLPAARLTLNPDGTASARAIGSVSGLRLLSGDAPLPIQPDRTGE